MQGSRAGTVDRVLCIPDLLSGWRLVSGIAKNPAVCADLFAPAAAVVCVTLLNRLEGDRSTGPRGAGRGTAAAPAVNATSSSEALEV